MILYCLPATFFSSALSLCVLSRHIYWQNVPALTDATAYTEKSHIYSIEIERKSRALAIHTIRYQIIPWKWVSRTFERNFSRDKNTSHKCWSNRSASRDVNKISIWFTNTEPFIYIFYKYREKNACTFRHLTKRFDSLVYFISLLFCLTDFFLLVLFRRLCPFREKPSDFRLMRVGWCLCMCVRMWSWYTIANPIPPFFGAHGL